MAAGGFKEFVAGEVLDQDEINDYLMQGVLVFAGTAARGSAITSPVEGQFSFLADSDKTEFYDGTQWVELAPPGVVFETVTVGGGAGGGAGTNLSGLRNGGGGGAGGYLSTVAGEKTGGNNDVPNVLRIFAGTSFTVTVGAGGAGGSAPNQSGVRGSNSQCYWQVALGGQGGGSYNDLTPLFYGASGGGGAGTSGVGGTSTPFQGFNGSNAPAGAGGGAGEAGGTDGTSLGGDGLASSITGSSVIRAGGGSGGDDGGTALPGGDGGGGAGASGSVNPTAGTVNTGGGGGGGNHTRSGAAGGSGIVIMKYPSSITLTIGGGLTSSTSTSGNFKITTFTAGTDTVSF